ncbi:MAG: multidrug effflux MFS transporter [Afipia felis]|jgi:DHA1 family bicyclomycin/chloramphenicol resistance-like MFS transporter|uniref:multidrug effflux MFS transporter n=1 Tax=Rhizobium sp. WW_1 TaxID=1907375 RepID=UPI0009DF0FF7|nr:multidrug effflux MFS transporter [Rhizobium sp. WW_1]MBN9604652.1 multidrug effflux MFS transporter [Afipia felis]RKD74823.1 DHA1 family bicyclomycin/chloramphenicol resistance-like MFS transporter [Rhizobium sp. WW_1]
MPEIDKDDSPPRNKAEVAWLTWLLGSYTMLGPFSISTYMPFFPMLMVSLGVTQLELQQTLSVYLAGFGFMMLLHGPLSDAFGRRPIVLAGLAVYLVASIGGALSTSLALLILFRMLQGLSVGAGSVVGRAVVRDRLEGPEAQRLLSHITMIFGLAPAAAPVVGGWLHNWFPWQSVFLFMAAFSFVQLIASYFYLPETLQPAKRASMRPTQLARSYGSVLRSRSFWLLSLALSSNFIGFFLYVSAAPRFVIEYLGLKQNQFGWLFIPAVSGVIFGAYLSGKFAGRFSPNRTVAFGFLVMMGGAALNLSYNAFFAPVLPWVVLPIMIFTIGMSLATPSITLLTLDLFPNNRGMAASMQGFIQTVVMTLVSGFAAPLLGGSGMKMALGMLLSLVGGYLAWAAYRRCSSFSGAGVL